jgi:hypothetical protein
MILFSTTFTFAQTPVVSDKMQVLIIYQERSFFGDRRDSVSVIEELLGHFEVQVTESPISRLALFDFNNFDAIFVIALDQRLETPELIEQLAHYKGQILWLGSSIDQLIEAGHYPLHYDGENYNFVTIEVMLDKGLTTRTFPIGEKRVFYQVTSLSQANTVHAWLGDGQNKAPYIIQSGNLSYVSRVDMNEPLFYIFADFLHTILPDKDTPKSKFLISIQDVHGFSDQVNLRNLADQFHENNIPFSVQLIPYVRMMGSKSITRYDEIPKFVETLRYLESKGGNLIIEAYPTDISASEIQAFNLTEIYDTADIPLKSYLEENLNSLARQKLHPIGISSPHRALTDAEYLYAKAHFSTYIGHRYIEDSQLIIYPFVLSETRHFNTFYPLNLGYINPNLPESSATFEDQLYKISLVPDCFTGVFLSPDLDPKFIETLVVKATQYHLSFFDLKAEHNWIRTDYLNFDTIKDTDYISTAPELKVSPIQKFIELLSNSVLFLLAFALILFTLILRRSLRQTNQMYKKR